MRATRPMERGKAKLLKFAISTSYERSYKLDTRTVCFCT